MDLPQCTTLPQMKDFTVEEHEYVDKMLAREELYGKAQYTESQENLLHSDYLRGKRHNRSIVSPFSTTPRGSTFGSVISDQHGIYGHLESKLVRNYRKRTAQQRPCSPTDIELEHGLSVTMVPHPNSVVRDRSGGRASRSPRSDASTFHDDDTRQRYHSHVGDSSAGGGGGVHASSASDSRSSPCTCRTEDSPWMRDWALSGRAFNTTVPTTLPAHIRKALLTRGPLAQM